MVGEHDKTEGQHQGEHAVSAILPHPAYTAAPPYPHDAALLTLAAPLTFSARVAPVCLPAAASLYAGRVATVTGWGSTLLLGASSAVLREANVTIMANEECGEAFSDSFDSPWIKKYFCKNSYFIFYLCISSVHICTNGSGKGVCSGDSGGPMFLLENGRYTQVR